MKKGILLFFLILATGCTENQTGSPAPVDTSSEAGPSSAFEAKIVPSEPGSETISTPNSVTRNYTVGIQQLPENPKNYYFAIESINKLFGSEIITPVEYSEAQIQINVDTIDGTKMGIAYVYAGPICNVTVDPKGTENWKTIAHEVLHCLGFGHAKSWSSLMNAYNDHGDFTQEMVPLWEKTLDNQQVDGSSKQLAAPQGSLEPNVIED